MADTKISALGAAAALGGTEKLAGVQAGASVAVTPAQVLAFALAHADTTERVQDIIGAMVSAGQGLAAAYDDGAGTLTIGQAVKSNVAAGDPTTASDSAAGYATGSTWYNSATAVAWRCQDATAGAALWSAIGAMDHPGYVSGRCYPPQHSAVSGATPVADTLYAVPFYVAQRVTLQGLGLRVTTGVASTAGLLGIYANNPATARPGAKIAELSGAVITTTSSSDALGSFTTNPTLVPGMYWLASLFNGAPTVQGIASTDRLTLSLLGGSSYATAVGTTGVVLAVTGTATYAGGLPASFGTTSDRVAATAMPAFKIA